MSRIRYLGFIFITYNGDHPPFHVHILTSSGRNIGRFDIEHQCPMDDFRITKKLSKAVIDLGYLLEESEK